MDLPLWLRPYANETDLREIQASVESVESRTNGEVVPMVVRASTLNGHVAPILTLLSLILFIVLAPYLEVRVGGPLWAFDVAALVFSVVVGFLGSKSEWLQRLATSRSDEAISVFHRAQLEFHQTGIPATEGRTGVLIFASLKERRAVILGDTAIAAKIKDETWVEIVDELSRLMGEKKLRDAFKTAIEKVGVILQREFPADAHGSNELSNELVIKD